MCNFLRQNLEVNWLAAIRWPRHRKRSLPQPCGMANWRSMAALPPSVFYSWWGCKSTGPSTGSRCGTKWSVKANRPRRCKAALGEPPAPLRSHRQWPRHQRWFLTTARTWNWPWNYADLLLFKSKEFHIQSSVLILTWSIYETSSKCGST